MGKGDKGKPTAEKPKNERALLGEDLSGMTADGLEVVWVAPGNATRYHGDRKSRAGGRFFMQCQKNSDGQFEVRFMKRGKPAVVIASQNFEVAPTPEEIGEWANTLSAEGVAKETPG